MSWSVIITLSPEMMSQRKERRQSGYGENDTTSFIRRNKRITLSSLQISGKLNGYLADIDRQAEEMFELLVNQMAAAEGITEQLKATDQMVWVGRMNNIRNRAIEIVNSELICR